MTTLHWLLPAWIVWLCAASPARAQHAEAAQGEATSQPHTALATLHTLPARRLPLRFSIAQDSDRTDLTVYLQTSINPVLGPGGHEENTLFELLCRAPCEASVRSGNHMFAVAAGARAAVKAQPALHVRRGQEVVLRYDNRLGLRVFGWTLLVAGALAGAALVAAGTPATWEESGKVDPPLIVGGSVLTALSLVGGLWLANMPDRASVALAR